MKTRTETVIDCHEWDKLVTATYGKPYCFQQQQGCQSRGRFNFSVPAEAQDDEMNESLPEVVNDARMGVRFEVWKARDPKQPLSADDKCRHDQWAIDLWWHRNFYPDFQTVANDLHTKGLLTAGNYTIDIDW
jgi:hypothetical protein